MASIRNRKGFIWLHQAVVLVSGIAAFNISEKGDFILAPLFVALFPLLLAFNFWWKEPEPVDAKRLHTYFISSLVGTVFALAIMAWWVTWAVAIMVGGFH